MTRKNAEDCTCKWCGYRLSSNRNLGDHEATCREFTTDITSEDIQAYGHDHTGEIFQGIRNRNEQGQEVQYYHCPKCLARIKAANKDEPQAAVKRHYDRFHVATEGKYKCKSCRAAFLGDPGNSRLILNMTAHLKKCRGAVEGVAPRDQGHVDHTSASRSQQPTTSPAVHQPGPPLPSAFQVVARNPPPATRTRPVHVDAPSTLPDVSPFRPPSPDQPVSPPYTSPPYYAHRQTRGGVYPDPSELGFY